MVNISQELQVYRTRKKKKKTMNAIYVHHDPIQKQQKVQEQYLLS